jgi:hypothetical protein
MGKGEMLLPLVVVLLVLVRVVVASIQARRLQLSKLVPVEIQDRQVYHRVEEKDRVKRWWFVYWWTPREGPERYVWITSMNIMLRNWDV